MLNSKFKWRRARSAVWQVKQKVHCQVYLNRDRLPCICFDHTCFTVTWPQYCETTINIQVPIDFCYWFNINEVYVCPFGLQETDLSLIIQNDGIGFCHLMLQPSVRKISVNDLEALGLLSFSCSISCVF